jgi:pilus assembly protein CpaB
MAKKKLLIAAVIVGSFAALLVYLYSQQQEKKVKNLMKDQVEVIKAARDIPAGTPLTQDKVTSEKVPQRFLPPNPVLKKEFASVYAGTAVESDIQEGAMILTSDFAVSEVASTLASNIPPSERAMSIPVDSISGISGLLRPGDRVDVLGTFPVGSEDQVIKEAGGGQSVGYVTMTLLQNVTLLAVGQEIAGVSASRQQGGGRARGGYSTVTASVTIDEAELLTIAQTRGELMLLLRHNEDVEIGTVKRKTLKQVLEELEVINRAREVRTRERKPCPRGCDEGERCKNNKCVPDITIYRGSD